MKYFILCFLLASCLPKTPPTPESGNKKETLNIVDQAIDAYNRHDLPDFQKLFSDEINYFKEHGRGSIRLITDKQQFLKHFAPIFTAKTNKIEIKNTIYMDPWVIKHQIVKTSKDQVEAVVAYRVKDGKILDVMIIGE